MSWNFFPRPFLRREASPTPNEAQAVPRAAATANDSSFSVVRNDTLFLARHAICDATQKVRAYQLLMRATGLAPTHAPETAASAAHLIVNTLNTFGVADAVGDRLAWVALPEQSLDSDIVELLPKTKFILEYPAAYLNNANASARCAQLLAQGYNLAYPCQSGDYDIGSVASVANYVVYDLAAQSMQEIAQLDRAVSPHGLTRLVRNVNTHSDFDACKAFNFDL